jgi:hypothetical protein
MGNFARMWWAGYVARLEEIHRGFWVGCLVEDGYLEHWEGDEKITSDGSQGGRFVKIGGVAQNHA